MPHQVAYFEENTRPDVLDMRDGRLNFTLRCDPWTLRRLRGRDEAAPFVAALAAPPPWRAAAAAAAAGVKRPREAEAAEAEAAGAEAAGAEAAAEDEGEGDARR